jgi:hypothetical protein
MLKWGTCRHTNTHTQDDLISLFLFWKKKTKTHSFVYRVLLRVCSLNKWINFNPPKLLFSGMWRRVVWHIIHNISKDPAASTGHADGDGRFLRNVGRLHDNAEDSNLHSKRSCGPQVSQFQPWLSRLFSVYLPQLCHQVRVCICVSCGLKSQCSWNSAWNFIHFVL